MGVFKRKLDLIIEVARLVVELRSMDVLTITPNPMPSAG